MLKMILFFLISLSLKAQTIHCIASWERLSDHGKVMANGKKFNTNALTCATWRYPLGAIIRCKTSNGFHCTAVVTDRTAVRYNNRIDLSPICFRKLNGLELGICNVTVERIN